MTDTTTAAADLVAALGALTDPRKDGKVSAGQRQYRYLELPDLLAEVRAKFAQHGWAIMQVPDVVDGHVVITNVWLHTSGERMTHPPYSLPCGRTPQEIGSATTYARRYSLAALVGLAGSDDDDAQAAQQARRVDPLSDPDPWQTPPPPPPPKPATLGNPIPMSARKDPGTPSNNRPPSDKQIKYLWTLMRKAGMSDEEVRAWVAHKLVIDPGWHTHDLSAADVSLLINELKPADELPLPPEPQ